MQHSVRQTRQSMSRLPTDLAERASSRTTAAAVLAVIVLAGAALRLQGLGREAFWFNEAASFYYAKGPLSEVIRHSFVDETNPPGFHILIHFWMGLVGIQEWALRLPSAVAGTLTIAVMALFARHFLSRAGSLAAAAMLAFSPLHVWYSQECRAFAIWLLCILCAYHCFWKWLRTSRTGYLFLNGVFLVLSVSFHYFGVHAILAENAYLLLARPEASRRRWRAWLWSQALLVIALVPFAAMMLMVSRTNVAWWKESGLRLQAIKSLFFQMNGVYYFLSHEWPAKAGILLANAAAFVPGVLLLRRQKQIAFFVVAIFLPLVVNLLYSLLISPILGNSQSVGRYFLLILPPYLIVLAAGWEWFLVRFQRPWLWRAALAAYLGLCLLGVRASRVNEPFTRDDNRRLSAILLDRAAPGDLLVASPYITLDYYGHRLGRDLDRLTIIKTARFDQTVLTRMPERAERVWCYFDPFHHYAALLDEIQHRYGLRIVLEERERRLSGPGLVLLEPAVRSPR